MKRVRWQRGGHSPLSSPRTSAQFPAGGTTARVPTQQHGQWWKLAVAEDTGGTESVADFQLLLYVKKAMWKLATLYLPQKPPLDASRGGYGGPSHIYLMTVFIVHILEG